MNSVNVFSGIRKTVKMPFKIPKFEGISDVLRKAERQQNFIIITLRLAHFNTCSGNLVPCPYSEEVRKYLVMRLRHSAQEPGKKWRFSRAFAHVTSVMVACSPSCLLARSSSETRSLVSTNDLLSYFLRYLA